MSFINCDDLFSDLRYSVVTQGNYVLHRCQTLRPYHEMNNMGKSNIQSIRKIKRFPSDVMVYVGLKQNLDNFTFSKEHDAIAMSRYPVK